MKNKAANAISQGAKFAKKGLTKTANKTVEGISNVAGVAADSVSEKATNIAETTKQKYQETREWLYNPLFPEEFNDPNYDRPKMIIIVDEDNRKGIDICEGAVGYQNHNLRRKLEMLYLYEEVAAKSSLVFIPRLKCDTAYFEDSNCKGRYIAVDQFFEIVQAEMITELKDVARALGAKECFLEYESEEKTFNSAKLTGSSRSKITIKTKKGKTTLEDGAESEAEVSRRKVNAQKYLLHGTFEGGAASVPNLKWYKNDPEINSLIKSRTEGNIAKTYTMKLESFSSVSMSAKTASKIDANLKEARLHKEFSLSGKHSKESKKKMVFSVTF